MTSVCPNGDPAFTSLLRKTLGEWAGRPASRQRLFWFICVPFRFMVYSLFLVGVLPIWLARLGALMAALSLATRVEGTQWWDRRIDLTLATAAVFSPQKYVSWILLTSVVLGVLQAGVFC